jgi:methionine-rich copper-binding protein CopC
MSSIPIPTQKPQIQSSGGNIWSDLLDFGTGVLSRVAEVNLEAYEMKQIEKAKQQSKEADQLRDDRIASGITLPQNLNMDSMYVQIAIVGAIGLLVVGTLSFSKAR